MRLDGRGRDDERLGDLGIRLTLGDQLQHLDLTRGQVIWLLGRFSGRGLRIEHGVDEPLLHGGIEMRAPRRK